MLALAIGAAAFVFRLTTFELSNDDYLHLASAQLVLLGEVPVRDFIDPGEELFVYVSAWAQRLLGPTVFSEVLLDVAALAVAYVAVFLLAFRLARSRLAAGAAVGLIVLMVPRLYAYPKLLLYPICLWLIWRYADRPGLGRLLTVAVGTVVAFLFRHDHGTYIGLTMGLMLALVHAPHWRLMSQRMLAFGVAGMLLVSPFLVFLQLNGGVVPYFQNMLDTARGEYERTVGDYPPFRLKLAAPRVTLQWAPDVDAPSREALASRYSLSTPYLRGDGQWEYDLNDRSEQNMAALVAEPRVADTSGFDRERFRLTAPIPEPNVLAWFYYLTFALAPLALLVVASDIWRRQVRAVLPHERLIITTAVLAVIMNVYLMRSASESAVGDVSAITGVIGAWLLARGWTAARVTPGAVFKVGATLALFAVSIFFAVRGNGGFAIGRTFDLLREEGLTAVEAKINGAKRLTPPFETPMAQYAYTCSRPTDRLLMTWYSPDIHYGSGRGFAAGRPYFFQSFAPSPAALAFSFERLQSQRVPIVFVHRNYEQDFAMPFPTFADYLRDNYRDVGPLQPGDDGVKVLVDRRLESTSTWGEGMLPCFR